MRLRERLRERPRTFSAIALKKDCSVGEEVRRKPFKYDAGAVPAATSGEVGSEGVSARVEVSLMVRMDWVGRMGFMLWRVVM